MARVTEVDHARKDQGTCGRCGTEIKKGDPYRHASPGFRGPKLVRCMAFECRFRPSDLTTSKMADVYAAQEAAHDDLDRLLEEGAFTDPEDVRSVLEAVVDESSGVADEYREAAEAMGDAGSENEERADAIEAWCDDLGNFEDTEGVPDDDADAEAWAEWREGLIEEARSVLDSLEV